MSLEQKMEIWAKIQHGVEVKGKQIVDSAWRNQMLFLFY